MGRDWVQWHGAYDDPESSLFRRLAIVTRMVRGVIDSAPPGPISVLSLCAGDGRDLLGAVSGHPRVSDLSGMLVELDAELAATAAVNMASLGTDLSVRNADAGDTAAWRSAGPADILLLCGIFGNIATEDIRNTIAAVPAICRPGATVLWTRHRRDPDMTPAIRGWFDEAGCHPVEFVSPGPNSFAVGCERLTDVLDVSPLPTRLFTFVDSA